MKRRKSHKQFLRQFRNDPLNAALWIDLVRHFPQTLNLACTWLSDIRGRFLHITILKTGIGYFKLNPFHRDRFELRTYFLCTRRFKKHNEPCNALYQILRKYRTVFCRRAPSLSGV